MAQTIDDEQAPETSGAALDHPVLLRLAEIVLAERPLGDVLHQIAEIAREAIPGVDDVSVTLLQDGVPRSAAFAGDGGLAAYLDERQYEAGFGPCLDAAASGMTIAIADTALDESYPQFSREAARRGVRHTLAVGLPSLYRVTGALNLYGRSGEAPFSLEAQAIAGVFGGYAAVALTNAALYAGAVDEVAQMREAMQSRAVIEQAKGVIIAQTGADPDGAFAILRERSMSANLKLRDVAVALVDRAVKDAAARS